MNERAKVVKLNVLWVYCLNVRGKVVNARVFERENVLLECANFELGSIFPLKVLKWKKCIPTSAVFFEHMMKKGKIWYVLKMDNCVFQIFPLTKDTAGTYECHVNNAMGEASATGTIHVVDSVNDIPSKKGEVPGFNY